MKSIKLGTRTLALAACLSCALPLAAQTTTGTGGATGTGGTTGSAMSTGTGTDTTTRRDSGFDWGWLGLIGLAGLLGRRRGNDTTTMSTPRTTATR